ncbi:MAG: 16S rRNA (cytosine(1402)-N(4))-methyltransferase, partial [Fusobacteriaceae bacterium]
NKGLNCLKPEGRLAIITFHSLEDRMVKTMFKEFCTGCICPPRLPICMCNNKPKAKQITRKPIIPSQDELKYNKRAHSSKLRVIEKV